MFAYLFHAGMMTRHGVPKNFARYQSPPLLYDNYDQGFVHRLN
jgi:hypothetical protein